MTDTSHPRALQGACPPPQTAALWRRLWKRIAHASRQRRELRHLNHALSDAHLAKDIGLPPQHAPQHLPHHWQRRDCGEGGQNMTDSVTRLLAFTRYGTPVSMRLCTRCMDAALRAELGSLAHGDDMDRLTTWHPPSDAA